MGSFNFKKRGQARLLNGQAAMELAVFGAIVIFVVGMIVRTAVSTSYSQNTNFKAMRYAMLLSLQSAKKVSTSRNIASVIYIEDRLSADFSKYGSLDRVPYIAQGSGTFTNMLFYNVEEEEVESNLPIMDIYINGVHLPLTTSRFVDQMRTPPLVKDQETTGTRYNTFYLQTSTTPPDPRGDGTFRYRGWDFKCVTETINKGNPPSVPPTLGYHGCPLYYTIVMNGREGWCDEEPCNDKGILNINERFDLNRNDDFTDDPKDNTRTKIPRGEMLWQWGAIRGTVGERPKGMTSYDINNDRKEEVLYSIVGKDGLGIITGEKTQDATAGDLDLTRDDSDQGQVGLLSETAIYTRPRITKDGGNSVAQATYMEIKNGKLFTMGSNAVVRSLNKRDTVDVIERRIRLSNNTGRFCTNSNPPVAHIGCIAGLARVKGVCPAGENPIEVCTASVPLPNTPPPARGYEIAKDCFTQANVAKTCMDVTTKIIYVRSRLMDGQGHKWVTDASSLNVGIGTTEVGAWGELGVK